MLGKGMRCRYGECNACLRQLFGDGFDFVVDMVSRGLSILRLVYFQDKTCCMTRKFSSHWINQQDNPFGINVRCVVAVVRIEAVRSYWRICMFNCNCVPER